MPDNTVQTFLNSLTPGQRATVQQWLATFRTNVLQFTRNVGGGSYVGRVEEFLDSQGVTNPTTQAREGTRRQYLVEVEGTIHTTVPVTATSEDDARRQVTRDQVINRAVNGHGNGLTSFLPRSAR